MVLESVINPFRAEKQPEEMVLLGFIFATIAIGLAVFVFQSYASFAMVTFTVMAILPLMVQLMKIEKEKIGKVRGILAKEKTAESWNFLQHKDVVMLFIFLFLGFVAGYMIWFLLLPVEASSNLFFLQMNTLSQINNPTGAITSFSSNLVAILANNFRILGLSFLFSFVFGSGAIFILVWNASVLSVALGTSIKLAIATTGASATSYFAAFSFAILRYMIHGIPEILAYFLAGLAGAIIGFTLLDYKIGLKKLIPKLQRSSKDAALLCLSAGIILIASGILEITITSLFIQ